MSRRRLSDDDRTLWTHVTKSIAPLKKRATRDDPSDATTIASAAPPAPMKARSKPVMLPSYTTVPVAPPSPTLEPLGRKLKKRVARGAQSIDGRLDLHGLTQAEAHHALLRFLRQGQERGARIVLVITGKGDGSGERGVLKRQVPLWLRLPEFRGHIVGFEDAAHAHGGAGALYVRLKRARFEE
jgi:DNA-nicking Smr family endonuclease